jgi:DNA-binding phage protein
MKQQDEIEQIRMEFMDIKRVLNEKSKRWWCASKVRAYNRIHVKGGVSVVSEATGISRTRIYRALKEMGIESEATTARIRKEGGGRKKNNGESTKFIG